jgi:hypothetical protein
MAAQRNVPYSSFYTRDAPLENDFAWTSIWPADPSPNGTRPIGNGRLSVGVTALKWGYPRSRIWLRHLARKDCGSRKLDL